MKQQFFYIILICLYFSCQEKSSKEVFNATINNEISDSNYVINHSFPKGDIRRYGLLPETDAISNFKSSKNALENILNLAEQGLEIIFPKGHYKTGMIIKGKKNLNFYFDDASFSGQIQIIDGLDNVPSQNINFKGKLVTYSKFFTRNSQNITIEDLLIKTDTTKNSNNKESLGCSIYAGSKHITIDSLIIDGLGSQSKYYQHSAAALQLHGWNNNPEHVTINYLEIKSSDRHGAYITGNNHVFNTIKIEKFGTGSNKNIFPLGDAKDDEVKTFSGFWINRCNDCEFNNVEINTNNSLGDYSLKLDEGQAYNPSFIYNLKLIEGKNKLPILDDYLTNILVKRVERN